MDWNEFFSIVVLPIIGTALTAIIGYIGIKLKALVERKEIDSTKKQIAKTCVQAVEQIYKDLHGAEKFNKAVEAMTEMLAERGIVVSDLEIQMLIESAVQQMNANILQPLIDIPDDSECDDCAIDYTAG